MAFQLVACGNVREDDEGELRELAPSPRAVDDVADVAVVASSTRIGGAGAPGQRGGYTGGGWHRAHPVPPKPNPTVTPDGGWEAALCAGAATRHVRMTANLDAVTQVPWFGAPFSAENPTNTAAFGATFAPFDDQGRRQMVTVYFTRLQQGWDYHVVMDGTAFVIGEGHLDFDDQGLVTVDVRQELRLLTASGPGHSVELDLSAVTQLAEPSQISELDADGTEARWGSACSTSQPPPDEPAVTDPHCAAAATTRFALRANLAAASAIAHQPWNLRVPTAGLILPLEANDANGALIDFDLYLRKASTDTWDYHALLAGKAPGVEVASGTLSFNPNGSLRSVTTTRVLRLPNHDGALGDAIELDFGDSTATGGGGVDGVTSLPGGSFEIWQQRDGAVLDCLPRASTTPPPVSHALSCAGERTTAVRMGFNLDPATALNAATPFSASVAIYDATLTPQQLELHFWRVEDRHWQCQVVASATAIGVVDLNFAANGAPELIENIPLVRLRLADGSAGPPIQLAFDEGWTITSFPSPSNGWLAPNGAPPHSDGCVN